MELNDYSMILHKRGGGSVDYQVANTDVLDAANTYAGYLNNEGGWLIMKQVTTDSVMVATYVKGSSAYDTAWTARATQTYVTFNNLF